MKEELTYKKALELSIPIWQFLARTGFGDEYKGRFIRHYQKGAIALYGEPRANCWLCEIFLVKQGNIVDLACYGCPIANHFIINRLFRNSFYDKWDRAKEERVKKHLAHRILTVIKVALEEEKELLSDKVASNKKEVMCKEEEEEERK